MGTSAALFVLSTPARKHRRCEMVVFTSVVIIDYLCGLLRQKTKRYSVSTTDLPSLPQIYMCFQVM